MRDSKSASKSSLSLKATALIFLLLTCAGTLQAQQVFGYVLDVRGDWVLNGSNHLSKGGSVSVGGIITAGNPSDGASYIVITDRNGNIFDRRNCNNGGECSKPINIPRAIESQRSFTSKVVSAVMAIVSGDPAKYASFVSRGADLHEAVTKLSNQKVDLSQVFKNMQGDRYLVRFERIGKEKNAAAKPLEMEFNWDTKKPEPLEARGLQPGLYRVSVREVSLLAPDDASDSTANEAWVLVASPSEYAKAAPSFNAAVNVTKQWGEKVKPNAVRQFLRATLEFITTQSSR